MADNVIKYKLYKSALLHDIGKFWQRTYNPDAMKEVGPGLEKHPVMSEKFAREWLGDDDIAFIVANHHETELKKSAGSPMQKALAALVCEADNLASSEREGDNLPYRRYFQAILSRVMLQTREDKPWKQAIGRLTAEKYTFPFEDKSEGITMTQQYRRQWEELYNEAGKIQDIHPDSLLYLCKKYLWCVPAAFYKNVPDISLYEHSRITAALALCLYDYLLEQNGSVFPDTIDITAVKDKRKEPAYLLVCGDITGIQKYIYNIAHSGAMKALKGRSFWLQQVVDSIAYTILDKCELYHANMLFSTGGKFCLLLPNTKKVEIEFGDLQPMLEQNLLEEYDGNLSLAMGKLPVSGEEIRTTINERWAELFRITDEAKTKKYRDLISDLAFFDPGKLYGELQLCQATKKELFHKGELPTVTRANADVGSQLFDKIRTPSGAIAYEELADGRTLTNSFISSEQHLAIKVGYDIRNSKTALIKTREFGYNVLNIEEIDFLKPTEVKSYKNVSERILYLNSDEHLGDYTDKSIIQGWRFYGGDWRFDESFEELIKTAYGYERLGVLRMDVDNLGHIFREGLERPAFSRIVQLSTMMDFFFSCYLNKLKTCWWCVEKGVIESKDDAGKAALSMKEAINIVYAGGDDLFIVGVWNVLPDVARWIHRQFTEFSCNNPDLTISAGIALFENKFPLYKAAKYAQDALDMAKSWKMQDEPKAKKNSICFLGIPMGWDDFELVRSWATEWAGWIDNKKISKGFLGLLDSMSVDYADHLQLIKRLQKEEGPNWHNNHVNIPEDPLWGRWRWRGCYYLNRFADRLKNDKEVESAIRAFSVSLFINKFDLPQTQGNTKLKRNCIDILPVAVRWADYLTRTKS